MTVKDQTASFAPNGCYVNRELSWLQFNRRVLEEAEDPATPLCERLNFASIFQSNLDEFYMVRVGMLMDTLHLTAVDDKTGLTSAQQTAAVLDRTRDLLAQRDRVCRALMAELADQGVELCPFAALSDKQLAFLEKYFTSNVLPLLSPQIIGRKQPFPFLRNKAIYAVAILRTKSGGERMGIVPCGDGVLRRLVPLPGDGQRFVLVEELIAGFLSKIFAHYKVEGAVLIRLVRSADIHMDEASSEMSDMLAEEYRKSMEKLIRRRKRLQPVKLEYQGKLSDTVRDALCTCLGLSKKHLFSSGVPLDLSFLGGVRDLLREKTELFYPRRVPQNSPNVDPLRPVAQQVRKRDRMLSYPYESVRPMLRLLREAGQDPEVVSIKMTLYRVAHNSKIVEALVDAAENGKEVVALVELRARFDEENNIGWSRVLEQSG
ncbi:MAG: polyphosphate kinase 1, partial [Lawsonibacter sp.]|nr:polyphosphate kinase 1 [Lawsonibacter sp.]